MKVTPFWHVLRYRQVISFFKNSAFLKFHAGVSSYTKFKRPESNLVTMKLDTPNFRAVFTPEVNMLSEMFQKYNYEIRMAGGAVRDLLMNKQPEDIDFATVATPNQMKNMFEHEGVRMLHRKGEAHGTVTVRINDVQNFEVTTLRVDMKTDGRHAEVEFTTDWELDAGRRDLTINAMFLGLDGTLYDYFNGREDLENRQVRFVGDPEGRIQEDYLRILRYFRFYGRIAVCPDSHDALTLDAVQRNVEGLGKISGERIWTELKKILAGNFSKEIMLRMLDLGVGPFIGLPDHANTAEYEIVCNRSHSIKPQPVTLLTALLKNEDEVMALHSRLKFSKYDRDLGLFIINNRNKDVQANVQPFYSLILESKSKISDVLEWSCEVFKYRGDACSFTELNNWKVPKFPINGHMLAEKGYKPGPQMNNIMSKLKTAWIESKFQMTKDQLLEILDKDKT